MLLAVLAPLSSSTSARAQDVPPANTLELNTWPSYLGPQVVLSGSVSSEVGIPDLNVIVENLDALDPTIFDGPPSTALRPPHGPPSASWRVPLDLPNGNYTLTVTSSLAGEVLAVETTTFEVVAEAVPPTIVIPDDATWSYYDAGDEPARSTGGGPKLEWFEAGYDTSAWESGPAPLGYGTDQVTTTAATGIFGQKIIAQYFRHEFDHTFDATDVVTATLRRDDGAVIYINGAEVARSNMPVGDVNYGTAAFSVSDATVDIPLDVADFAAGPNVIAVEVHQSSALSSDLAFSLSVAAGGATSAVASNNTEGTFLLTVGDMARCNFNGDEAVAGQMEDLFTADSGVFVALGDLAYGSGTISEFSNCYDPVFGQFRDVTWPSPGNHEHYTFPNAAGYRDYFGPAAGPTAGPTGGLWYSFDIDDYWHVIALDSDCRGREVLPGAINGDGCAIGSDQEVWLRADLEANKDKNILAFFHHPPYTNNRYTDHQYTFPLWRALAEYGVELTLHGHEHHYERYVPLDYWGDPAVTTGMTEFIIGSGGTNPRYEERPAEPESAFRGTFPVGTEDFGVLQLWLRPDEFEWKWESIEGLAATDSGIAGLVDPMPLAPITGVVTDVNDAAGIAGVEVCAEAERTLIATCVVTDAGGAYSIGPVVSDTYEITFEDPSGVYVAPPGEISAIVDAPTTAVADIVMWPRPSIAGTVTTEGASTPIDGATVCIDGIEPNTPARCVASEADGTYLVELVDPGQGYRVSFAAADHKGECYDDILGPCSSSATTVDVGTVDIAGIDAALVLNPGGIAGRVTEADTGDDLGDLEVCATAPALAVPSCAVTNSAGQYVIRDLVTAEYTVSFTDPTGVYMAECYNSQLCETATAVVVTQPRFTTGIDASLDPVPPGGPGDANCSVFLTSADAQVVLELGVGSRADGGDCPVGIGELNASAGDLNLDGQTDLLDALLIAQCDVGNLNEWCPTEP